jgi:hypothetical protein
MKMKRRLLIVAGMGIATLLTIFFVGQIFGTRASLAKTPRDADAITLVDQSQQALQKVSAMPTKPVLRQVDVDPKTGQAFFRFVDAEATREIDVDIPARDAPLTDWRVSSTTDSKLLGYRAPSLEMTVLRVGPAAVARAITSHWQGCTPGWAILFGTGSQLEWSVYCKLSDGRVATATLDGQTGEFRPSPAPPAYPPPTALPQ